MGTEQTKIMNPADVVAQEKPMTLKRTKKASVDRSTLDRLRNLTEEQLVDGIILSEILGKPVSMRDRRRRQG